MGKASIKEPGEVFNNYPYPIASLIIKYRKIPDENHTDLHSMLCDIFESLIKLIAIISLREIHSMEININKFFPQGLDFLKHSSLGQWLSIIRITSEETWDDQHTWLYKISKWFHNDKPQKDLLECYTSLPEISFQKGYSEIEGIANSLVTYRNKKWKGHGSATLDHESLKIRIPALEYLLFTLLQRADFLNEMNIFYALEVKKLGNKSFEASGNSFIGTDLKYCKFIYNEFEPGEIYLANSHNITLDNKPIMLSPLVEWKLNDKKEPQFYFLNDAKRNKIEYLSYIDESFYYHKDITQDLENILNIQIEQRDGDYEINRFQFTEEQRKEKYGHFYLSGLELARKKNWEGAVVAFEDALEWYRTPDVFVEVSKSMLNLGEDKEYINSTLEYALELDPYFEPAIELKNAIDNKEHNLSEKDEGTKESSLFNLTYLDLVIPAKLRNYSQHIWVMICFLFYGTSAVASFYLDSVPISAYPAPHYNLFRHLVTVLSGTL